MQALRKAIAETKLSNPQLSLKLGHSKKYLTNLLNDGCSTALQERLIEEINQVMAGTFKTDAVVIAELSQQLAEAQDESAAQWAISNDLYSKNAEIKTQMIELREANSGLEKESYKYFNERQEARFEAEQLKSNLEETKKSVIKLLDDHQTLLQTAQNDAETILKLKDDQTYLLNKYQRQKRFNAILLVLLFLTVISWVVALLYV